MSRTFLSYVELDEMNLARLKSYAEVYTPSSAGFEEAKQKAEAVLCIALKKEDVQMLKNLRFIQVLSAGVDGLPWQDIPQNVVVCGNMGSNADAVAEHAWSLVLTLAKKLHHYLPKVRSGDFKRDTTVLQLKGKTLCIVGMGSIGRRVAEIGKAFGMRVYGVTRSGSSPMAVDKVVPPDGLDEVLKDSDVIVLAAPLTKHTRGLISLERLRILKKSCILVNVGRAELIDREGLLAYMRENPEAAVATDVWWNVVREGPWENELVKHPNFIGTPWIAGAFGSPEVLKQMTSMAVENIIRYFRGEKPLNAVDKAEYV
ncbi:MAG: 2-hydroxyacid dehydrogenase [Candidatus Caldarchaeum sp.]